MILTRSEITHAVESGHIAIQPFDPGRLSPNAYDWRLGETIQVCDTDLDAAHSSGFVEQIIPPTGMVLLPGNLYLGVTYERTQSERYAQLINGDRTVGTLGIWVHVSAPLGHVGHAIRWTLEIRVVRPVRIYPKMTFGKIIFIKAKGEMASYQNMGRKYTNSSGIENSRLYEEIT
ncbi:dCTP deaminase domain-containing protein [Streptomyces sp. NPDC102274]|uniref:dCTP deaminase n=1 Tax=Streptomyces sp. NPDC102274 TaxID=3366151 RepID=UPI003816CBA0